MSAGIHALAVLCVGLIAAGQVLFKYSGSALAQAGSFLDQRVLTFMLPALALYGAATLMWISLLQHAPLNRLYPYMALSFVFVAAAGWALLGETLRAGQIMGLGLVLAGLVMIAAL